MTNSSAKPTKPSANYYYAYFVLVLCALFQFYKFLTQVYPGLITQQLMQLFALQGVGLGNLVASYFYSYMIMQFFVGILIDRFGVRILGSIAILVTALGVLLFASAKVLSVAILARLLMGLGVAFSTVSFLKIAAVWFPPNRFAFIGGLLATASMLGAIFGQLPLALMITHYGWRMSLCLWGIGGVVLAIVFIFFVRDHPAHQVHIRQQYFDWAAIKKVFLSKQNWLLTLYSGLAYSPIAVFAGLWGHPFLHVAYHLSVASGASLMSWAFLGLAVGGPGLGIIADRVASKRAIMALGTGLSLITLSIIIYTGHLNLWIVTLLLFLFGFGTGAFMLGYAFGRLINPVAVAATVIAMINSGDALFGAFTEPVIGKLLDLNWHHTHMRGVPLFSLNDFHYALWVLPCYLLIALLLLIWIKER